MQLLTVIISVLGVALAAPPNILFFLVDDFGHYNAGFNGNTNASTPHMDQLAREGIQLKRHYVYQYCSPTRSSLMSGRLPVHVNTQNKPSSENGGVDLRMTLISEKLKAAGYATHMSGKWHAGGYTLGMVPTMRGFDSSIGYLNGMEDHYTHVFDMLHGKDLWHNTSVAKNYDGVYGDAIYLNHTLSFISKQAQNDPKAPLFIYHAFQNTHVPLEVPDAYLDPALPKGDRQTYYGMANFVDSALANITAALQQHGYWNNTLVVLSADNGGPAGTGCNYPFRGFKYSDYEGGVRSAAFVSGPVVPHAVRGSSYHGLMHVADWYATFSGLAGVDPVDDKAVAAGVPPIDSIDMWTAITTNATSSRTNIIISADTLIDGNMKLIHNGDKGDGWSTTAYPDSAMQKPTFNCSKGCLFDVAQDPEERNDLSQQRPDLFNKMVKQLKSSSEGFFQTGDDGYVGPYTACKNISEVLSENDGYIAPCCNKPTA